MKLILVCLALIGSVSSALATEASHRCADGTVVTDSTVLPPNSHVFLYRDLPDEVPVPCVFVAATEHVYTVPFVRPVTVMGLPDAVPVIAHGLHVTV